MRLQGFVRRPAIWAFLTGSSLATTLVAQNYQAAPPPASYPPAYGNSTYSATNPAAGTTPPAASGYRAADPRAIQGASIYAPAQNYQNAPQGYNPNQAAPQNYQGAPQGYQGYNQPAARQGYQGAPQQGIPQPGYVAPNAGARPGTVSAAGGFADQRAAPSQAGQIPTTAPAGNQQQFIQVQGQQPIDGQAPQDGAAMGNKIPPLATMVAQPGEHPLAPAVRWAKMALVEIEKIQDYSCTLVKRERIDGTLGEHEYMFTKIRQKPFSVYMYFLAPAKLKGQECLFVAGQNDGNLLGHPNGIRHKLIGTIRLKPDGALAMAGNRYPITELGLRRLVTRLIEVGEHDMKFGDCEVKMIAGAKVSGRDCTCIQVVHTARRKEFIFNMARIFIDDQLNVPIRYEAYDFPKEPGGPPVQLEEYTYVNLKLNNGFTDQDFDPKNPNYQFQ